MQSLVGRLRAASEDSADEAMKRLLREAASEIARLQRAAYQGSAARPFSFNTVQEIRCRHVDDELAKDVDAGQAHEDRAQLLAILAFTRNGGGHESAACAELQGFPTTEMPLG